MLIVFVGTAALFVLGSIACLWHLRWVRRLPALREFAHPAESSSPPSTIRCSIVVAARNEQSRVEQTARRLLAQQHIDVELIVVNDRSSDRTGEILNRLAKEDSRLKVIHITALPDGWLGKCHACSVGANAASGEWILFTDADCWLKPDVTARAVRLAESEDVDHVTLTSGIAAPSPGLRACHLMFLLGTANWFSGVNRDRPKSHLGIGAFNMVRAKAYRECGGYERLPLTVLDDVKLGFLLRCAGKRTRAFLGADDVEAYWGESIGSLIKIMEKNYFAALEFNTLLALGISAFLTILLCVVVLGVVSRTPPGFSAAFSFFLLSVPAGILARRIGWSWRSAFGAPFVIPVFVCALLNSTFRTLRHRGVRWRETFYSLDRLRTEGVRYSRDRARWLSVIVLFGLGLSVFAQTKLKLSIIKPGTERVQLINNGDFQFQGPLTGTNYPFPTGWSSSVDMYANAGTNMVPVNSGVVARAQVNSGAPATGFSQAVSLEPATAYVFSAYVWNMGDAVNHVNTVMDLNDAPSEPQIVLGSGDSEAQEGYFVYRSFNTASTGANVTVRIFYDGFAGTGTAASNYPVAAQWDNVAITKSAYFLAPQSSGSTATLRPLVRITSPANGSFVYASGAALSLAADATDLDGTVTNVQFFAGTNKIGETSTSPWIASWSNALSGSYVLTAIAADNSGATTLSAPVAVSVTAPPPTPTLNIQASSNLLFLSWSSNGNGMVAQAKSNLLSPAPWATVTNPVQFAYSSNLLTLTISAGPQFFRLAPEVDASTLAGKLLMGYQGWFACPGDGSPSSAWIHWFRSQSPVATNATVDFWPDVSELDPDELFSSSMTYPGGSPAKLYSAYNAKTVLRHFKWMRDNHLDGVFLQRFSSGLSDASSFARMNKVADNVRAGADAYRRVFAVMYDISGHPTNTLVSGLTNDWNYLVTTLQITNSSRYLRHNGKPVVAIWGFGFFGRPDTPAQAQQVISFFKSAGLTVMGGLPTYWRTLNNDAQSDPAWAPVFRSFDIISPWSVGRYGDIAGADNFRVNLIVPDMADAAANGREYVPVIFPGFSWFNLNAGPLNQIPRNGGAFYWRQAYNAKISGCSMIYGAMFDEVDEGTAMYKLAPTTNEIPAQGSWVPLDIDGYSLPSDWYLRLANEASKMLRGDIPLQSTIPITP